MCGIAGIWRFDHEMISRHVLENMASRLVHRGPDGEGYWLRKDQKIGFAHRRLKIIDLSEAANQPMFSFDKKHVIVLNGEIYNYVELRKDLEKKGYTFSTSSDTEVLLYMYLEYGPRCLDFLDGMFAFALYDMEKDMLFCARDRFGEKPFFFSWYNNVFYFSSEVKALFEVGVPSIISFRGVYRYLVYHSVVYPQFPEETIYEYVKQLPHAHYILLDGKRNFSLRKYYDIAIDDENDSKQVVEKFRELFDTSVERRLRSDVPVGTSLSGGLDSSSIVVEVARKKQQQQVQYSFSARFPGFAKDEGYFIEKVIEQTALIPIYVYPNEHSVFNNLFDIFYHQEFPFGSTSIAAQYEVMKAARDHDVVVLLDGQGADETLAGYEFYRKTYLQQLIRKFHISRYMREKHALASTFQHPIHFSTKEWLQILSPWLFNSLRKMVRTSQMATQAKYVSPELYLACKDEISPYQYFIHLKKHLYFSTFVLGLQDLLRYADRNAMAHGVEVRLPFLYHELVNYVFSLPDDWIIYKGWSKFVLRKAMEPLLPSEITWRKSKIGYEPPQQQIFQSPSFQSLFNEATNFCIHQGFIRMPHPGEEWTYLMILLLHEFSNQWK